MDFRRIMITGGAGFVGANLAAMYKQAYPEITVYACDNLSRRGSELNLPRLKRLGVAFLHGDIRCREDVENWPSFDLLIDCSAEPSVQAGIRQLTLAGHSKQPDGNRPLHGGSAPQSGRFPFHEHRAGFIRSAGSMLWPTARI